MITAIDTIYYEASAGALRDAAGDGSLVISDIVYAELCIHFEAQSECDAFLETNEIRVQALAREAHFLASRAWRMYRQQEESGPESWRTF